MSQEAQGARYLSAVYPDTTRVLAKWTMNSGDCDHKITSLTEARQAMVVMISSFSTQQRTNHGYPACKRQTTGSCQRPFGYPCFIGNFVGRS